MGRVGEIITSNLKLMGAILVGFCLILLIPVLITEGKFFDIASEYGMDLSHLMIPYLLALVVTGVPGIILLLVHYLLSGKETD